MKLRPHYTHGTKFSIRRKLGNFSRTCWFLSLILWRKYSIQLIFLLWVFNYWNKAPMLSGSLPMLLSHISGGNETAVIYISTEIYCTFRATNCTAWYPIHCLICYLQTSVCRTSWTSNCDQDRQPWKLHVDFHISWSPSFVYWSFTELHPKSAEAVWEWDRDPRPNLGWYHWTFHNSGGPRPK